MVKHLESLPLRQGYSGAHRPLPASVPPDVVKIVAGTPHEVDDVLIVVQLGDQVQEGHPQQTDWYAIVTTTGSALLISIYASSAKFSREVCQLVCGRLGILSCVANIEVGLLTKFVLQGDLSYKGAWRRVLKDGDRVQWIWEAHISKVASHFEVNKILRCTTSTSLRCRTMWRDLWRGVYHAVYPSQLMAKWASTPHF